MPPIPIPPQTPRRSHNPLHHSSPHTTSLPLPLPTPPTTDRLPPSPQTNATPESRCHPLLSDTPPLCRTALLPPSLRRAIRLGWGGHRHRAGRHRGRRRHGGGESGSHRFGG